MGAPRALAAASVVDRHRIGFVLDHELAAWQSGMAQLDQAATVVEANPLDRAAFTYAQFPQTGIETIEHRQLRALGERRAADRAAEAGERLEDDSGKGVAHRARCRANDGAG